MMRRQGAFYCSPRGHPLPYHSGLRRSAQPLLPGPPATPKAPQALSFRCHMPTQHTKLQTGADCIPHRGPARQASKGTGAKTKKAPLTCLCPSALTTTNALSASQFELLTANRLHRQLQPLPLQQQEAGCGVLAGGAAPHPVVMCRTSLLPLLALWQAWPPPALHLERASESGHPTHAATPCQRHRDLCGPVPVAALLPPLPHRGPPPHRAGASCPHPPAAQTALPQARQHTAAPTSAFTPIHRS